MEQRAAAADRPRSRSVDDARAVRWDDSAPLICSPQDDEQWDSFLASSPGGNHLQSSYWAEAKSVLGWRAERVTVKRNGRILGGAQVLLRSVPGLGSIAYVSRGPVLARQDAVLGRRVLEGVDQTARDNRALLLVVQPPIGQECVQRELRSRGFRAANTLIEPHPTATVLVDVSAEDEVLLAAMKAKTRYNVRLAERRGVTVREGDERDVPTFHHLLTMTGQRQHFGVPSPEYFQHMVRSMSSRSHATILLAEYQGEPVSSALLIAFGDTVVFKRGAWSGLHGSRHPNELLHWTALRWARDEGYRYYDFEGIDAPVADHRGGVPTTGVQGRRSVSAFKLGFGGCVTLSPRAYERIDNPILRHGYDWLVPRLLESAPGRWLGDAVRTR